MPNVRFVASELKNSMIQKDLPVCVHETLWLIKVVSIQLKSTFYRYQNYISARKNNG